MSLNCTLLCACGATYDIDPITGKYTPDPIFSPAVDFNSSTLHVISAPSTSGGPDLINACLVGQNADGIIVAFRGTLPPGTPDSFEDWLQDFFVAPVYSPIFLGSVHEGFLDAVNSLIDDIIAAVWSLNPNSMLPVYVTGHSKGGGMAPLAAYMMHQAGITIQQVVTFAAPKSGDGDFQTTYQTVFSNNHTRYENYGDIAPLVPPAAIFDSMLAKALAYIPEIGPDLAAMMESAAAWGYVSVGTELFIESAYYDYQINPQENPYIQVGDFAYNLGMNITDPLTALGNAHTLAPGYGYARGVCPGGICPPCVQSQPAEAKMSVV